MNEIIVAIATPPGEGAIGIVRLSGAGCVELVDRFFPARSLVQGKERRDRKMSREMGITELKTESPGVQGEYAGRGIIFV